MTHTLRAEKRLTATENFAPLCAGAATFPARTVAQQTLQRVREKQQIIDDLIAGRLDLFQAASHFQSLSRGQSGGMSLLWGPETSNPENLCRSVIGWANLALRERPERAALIAEQLEQELQSHLTQHGGMCILGES
jgi:hypothetical protein